MLKKVKQRIHSYVLSNWYQTRLTWFACLLLPLSYLFRSLVSFRRLAYRRRWLRVVRLPVPVVVVGNITVGGSGKTPCIIRLAEYFRERGWRVGVVTRGYGVSIKNTRIIRGEADPGEVGDEPALIAKLTQAWIAVDPCRSRGALCLVNQYDCNLILSDDGLQHYGLARDIEIAVVDGGLGLGNLHELPSGPLRESVARLKEVDFVLRRVTPGVQSLSYPDIHAVDFSLKSQGFFRVQDDQAVVLGAGSSVCALAGIGSPEQFFSFLRYLGLEVEAKRFPDHYSFKLEDILLSQHDKVLMTEKDAIKCQRFATDQHIYLSVVADLPESLLEHLAEQLQKVAS